jgi:threonine aldolase
VGLKDVSVNLERVQTNFVLAHFESPRFTSSEFLKWLREKGVCATEAGEKTVRFVTSKQVSREDILRAIDAVEEVLSRQA